MGHHEGDRQHAEQQQALVEHAGKAANDAGQSRLVIGRLLQLTSDGRAGAGAACGSRICRWRGWPNWLGGAALGGVGDISMVPDAEPGFRAASALSAPFSFGKLFVFLPLHVDRSPFSRETPFAGRGTGPGRVCALRGSALPRRSFVAACGLARQAKGTGSAGRYQATSCAGILPFGPTRPTTGPELVVARC
jgi:hypothetical protein